MVITPWAKLPQDLADQLRSSQPQLEASLIAEITDGVPAFADISDAKFVTDVTHGATVAIARFLDLIATDGTALPPEIRDTFVTLGAAEAREDRSLEILAGALRFASRRLLRDATIASEANRPLTTEQVLDLADAVAAFTDELVAACTDGYTLQLREQASEGQRQRQAFAELLVRGGASESSIAASAGAIGWPSPGRMVPVVLAKEHARDARFRFADDGVLLDHEGSALLLVRQTKRTDPQRIKRMLAGKSVVIGPTVPWREVPVGVRLAQRLARTMGDGWSDRGVVFVRDHLVDLVCDGEPGALDVLRRSKLDQLQDVHGAERDRLLWTLKSWLRHWGSRPDVAAELFIHPQTVSYRLRRLRDLLGDELDNATARLEWAIVLSRQPTD